MWRPRHYTPFGIAVTWEWLPRHLFASWLLGHANLFGAAPMPSLEKAVQRRRVLHLRLGAQRHLMAFLVFAIICCSWMPVLLKAGKTGRSDGASGKATFRPPRKKGFPDGTGRKAGPRPTGLRPKQILTEIKKQDCTDKRFWRFHGVLLAGLLPTRLPGPRRTG
jgi:hypothetical protein